MKFRKKPVEIEAVRWNGRNLEEIKQFTNGAATVSGIHLTIATMEGERMVSEGDWIIKGIRGEFYPCHPEIFETTYERVMG